ncbi:MAG: thioredoxin-disulfide reductase [bacterium]|nr:thioredoxin-disulfide reductase [bacterium]
MNIHDVIIIGSGPAGYTAAIYAARGDLKTLVFKGTQPGGQLTTTTVIENWPGYEDGVDGNTLMMDMEKQAKRFGAEMKSDTVSKVDFSQQPLKVFVGETEYQTKTVIIATGARARRTNAPGEDKLFAKGVSTCATCDGFFYKGKDVIVMGGGDTAMEEANFLTKFCNSVTIVHRRDEFRASKIMADRVLNNDKISVIWDSEIIAFNGEEKLNSIMLRNKKTGEESEKNIDAVFLAIGHTPNTEIFKDQVELLESGYIKTNDLMTTSVSGVFFAGDCADERYRQAISAAGEGCRASMEVIKFVESLED